MTHNERSILMELRPPTRSTPQFACPNTPVSDRHLWLFFSSVSGLDANCLPAPPRLGLHPHHKMPSTLRVATWGEKSRGDFVQAWNLFCEIESVLVFLCRRNEPWYIAAGSVPLWALAGRAISYNLPLGAVSDFFVRKCKKKTNK